MTPRRAALLLVLVASSGLVEVTSAFVTTARGGEVTRARTITCAATHDACAKTPATATTTTTSRRGALVTGAAALPLAALGFVAAAPRAAYAEEKEKIPTELFELRLLLKESMAQLDEVPALLKAEKWDSVRALLIKPPLADLWEKRAGRPVLKNLATAIGDNDGDEMAALEAREDAISHLRFLDMAV